MLFTKEAAKRILGHSVKRVERVELMKNGAVLVVYLTAKGRCSTFVSRKKFMTDFVEVRREDARSLLSHAIGEGMYAVSSLRGGAYTVVTTSTAVRCSCKDYERQIHEFGRGCCKHGYHVLKNWFGLDSLKDYLTRQHKAA